MEQSDALQKFLRMPELIEKLVLVLDPLSALHLVQSNVIKKETLQESLSSKAWNELIGRSSHDEEGLLTMEDVQSLVKILKLVEVKEPSTFLLPLLDLICESGSNPFFLSELHIICPCNAIFHKI